MKTFLKSITTMPVIKVFHDCRADIEALCGQIRCSITSNSIFDTQCAYALLHPKAPQAGLNAVLKGYSLSVNPFKN